MKNLYLIRKNSSALLWVFILVLASCKKEEGGTLPDAAPGGAYVSNEGSFMNSNASVSFIAHDGQVLEDPFYDRNETPLGDVLQSLMFAGNRGYAVLNNSQRVVVFDAESFAYIGAVEGTDYPRHMLAVDSQKAYLTNGSMNGQVLIVDLNSRSVSGSVAVGNGPEQLVRSGNHVYVANSGGWLEDASVSVLDITTDQVVTTVPVGDRPVDLVTDHSGNIWVLCAGRVIYDASWNITGHTPAMLYRISSADHAVSWSAQVGETGDHPDDLAISPSGDQVYYNLNGIRRIEVSQPELPGQIVVGGDFHSLDVHPQSGEIWITSVPDFVSRSNVMRYAPSGEWVGTWQAGIGANGVYWR
jgi:YVTN family beta-propeller protein